MSKEKTIHELVKEFPDKSYRELEIYRNADRNEEAAKIPLTESQKSQEDLEVALANALAINESHQNLNGRLQERLTEVEEENKKLHKHVDKQVSGARKSGM